jgi:hypothetical protein
MSGAGDDPRFIQRNYPVLQPKPEPVLPIPLPDWNRLRELEPGSGNWGNGGWCAIGLGAGLVVQALFAAEGAKVDVQITFGLMSIAAGALCCVFHWRSSASLRREMDHIEQRYTPPLVRPGPPTNLKVTNE